MRTLVDYYVHPLSEEAIEAQADEWRARAVKALGYEYFNIVDFIRQVLRKSLKKGEQLRIKFMPADSPGPPAKVSFRPSLTLWVRVDVWAAAEKGDPLARYILAHECGHLILHSNEAKGFSDESGQRIPDSDRERSAEWQADEFANDFLAPIQIVERLRDVHQVVVRCGVPREIASQRLADVVAYWEWKSRPFGMDCDACFGCDTHHISSRVRCRTCGRVSAAFL